MKKLFIILSILASAVSAHAAPAGISDLTALAGGAEGEVQLQWTVPDTGIALSTPTAYSVKYATSQINNTDFNASWVSAYPQSWGNLVSSGMAEARTLTGITPGVRIYFAIVAVDSDTVYGVWYSSDDTGGAVNTANSAVAPDLPPGQAVGLTATGGDAFADLSWTANPEIDIKRYRLDRSSYSTVSGFSLLTYILNPGTTHHDALNLVNGNTYYYRVRAEDNTSNTGAYSDVVGTTPWVNVSQPAFSVYSAAVSTCAIDWCWTAAANAAGYRVILSTSGDVLASGLSASATHWLQSGLTPDTSSSVTLQAYNGLIYANSDLSAALYTLANPPYDIYSPLQPGTTSIDLQWTANGNRSWTRYNVERSSTGSGGWAQIVSLLANTTHQDTGLAEKATYYYRAWAVNSDGESTSQITFSTMTSSVDPQAPTFSAARSDLVTNDGEIRLQWLAPRDDDSTEPVQSYVIKAATFSFAEADFTDTPSLSVIPQGIIPTIPGNAEEVVVTGLYPGATFYFGIKAVDEAGNYSALPVIRSTVARDNVPPAPAGPAASALNETTVRVSWSQPAVSGYDDKAGYVVYRATFNFALAGQATYYIEVSTFSPGNYYDDSAGGGTNPLRRKTTYYYMVTTKDLGDGPAGSGLTSRALESLPTSVVHACTPDLTPPVPITDLAALQGAIEGRINLSWTSPADDYDTLTGDITGGRFRLDWETNPAAVFSTNTYKADIATTTVTGSANGYTVTGLTGGSTYYFRIWSQDMAGNWSAVSDGATAWAQVDVTSPGQVTDLAGTASWRVVSLSWTSPGDDGYLGNITGGQYDIMYSTDPSFGVYTLVNMATTTVHGARSNYQVGGLTDGTSYYFSVRTADEAGRWSDAPVSTPCVKPVDNAPAQFGLSLPADYSISPTASPALQWNPSADADTALGDLVNYTVYYSTASSFSANTTTAVFVGTSLVYTVAIPLPEDKTVYWKVSAADLDGAYAWSSSTYSVRINAVNSAPAAFALGGPVNSVSTNTATPLLSWAASSDVDPGDALTYQVDYSRYSNFSTYTSSAGLPALSYRTPSLTENATYWWRVWAYDGTVRTISSTTDYFVVNAVSELPNQFMLASPADGTRQLSLTATFYWDLMGDPDPFDNVTYRLVYSQFFTFTTSTAVSGLTGDTTAFALPFDNTKYYWKVQAVDADGNVRDSNVIWMTYTDIEKELPSQPNLLNPFQSQAITNTLTPMFQWSQSYDPDPADNVRYYIDISLDPAFAGSQPIPTGADNFFQPLNNLLDQSTYFWRVRASGYQSSPPVQADTGFIYSATGTFSLSMINNPPQSFALVSPANGASVDTKYPAFAWQEAEDTDLNDSVTYTIEISTVQGFGSVLMSAQGLTAAGHAFSSPLYEDRTYYWRVTARDKKAAETVCASTFSFTVPVVNRPASPAGLKGSLSADQQNFTVTWSRVIRNSDGSAIDDLGGYNIYRSLALATVGTGAPYAFAAAGTDAWTDTAVLGGRFFYLVRAVDASGNEGSNSLVLQSLEQDKMNLLSSDQQVSAELPAGVSSALLSENNQWHDNLSLVLDRKTNLEAGKVLRVYDLRIRDSNFNEVSGYNFSEPITLGFSYGGLAAQGRLAQQAFSPGELSVYWFDGVQYIRIGGYMNQATGQVVINITKPGQYQLRQIAKAASFGLASLTPAKVFTPDSEPYKKMTFYVDNPSGDKVTGKIFDLRGEYVADIRAVGDATATTVTMEWDGSGARKGVYIYQIEGDGKVVNGTIILAR